MLPCPGPSLSAHARPPCRLGHGADNVKPEAGSFHARRQRSGNPVKAFENAFQLGLRNTRPPISHAERDVLAVYFGGLHAITLTSLPEYFTALSIRFETAARTSSASPMIVNGRSGVIFQRLRLKRGAACARAPGTPPSRCSRSMRTRC